MLLFGQNRKNLTIAVFILFAVLVVFYKWQIKTSSDYLNLGDKNYNGSDFNEALKNYNYAAVIDGDRKIFSAAKIKRARIFYEAGLLDEAEKELREAISRKNDAYGIYELRGDVFFARRDFDKAISDYKEAIKLAEEKEKSLDISLKIVKSLIAQKKTDSARDLLHDLYLKDDRENISYYLGLLEFDRKIADNFYLEKLMASGSRAYRDKISEINDFIGAYRSDKNSDYNSVAVADLYNKLNEPYLAINKVEPTVKSNPGYRDAWLVMGKSDFIIKDYKKALEDFNSALRLDGHNRETFFWLASIYKNTGLQTKAGEFQDKFLYFKNN